MDRRDDWYLRICRYRTEHNLTWQQLCRQTGVPVSTLEKLKKRPPSLPTRQKLACLVGDSTETPRSLDALIGENILRGRAAPAVVGESAIEVRKGEPQPMSNTRSAMPSEPSANTAKQLAASGRPASGTIHPKEQAMRPSQRACDEPRLSDDQARDFLVPHENVRDPVHGDIWITLLERKIIDTPAFQRLRGLKQLGPTDLVYPGAVHTRFLHSLGTLHCAERIVQTANRNFENYGEPSLMQIDSYPHLLIRVCALIHDMAHVPFGHTLEDEGNLMAGKGEWEDEARADLWLGLPEGIETGQSSSVMRVVRDFLVESGVDEQKAKALVDDIRRYLHIAPSNGTDSEAASLMQLEYPFVHDVVGNTVCADLLDYLERDMYYCGLKERSGDRVMSYLGIIKVKQSRPAQSMQGTTYDHFEVDVTSGKGRVALLAYRVEREHRAGTSSKVVRKSEILSEAIDLLRRRFALAEKVYFHRTKIAASAMLISATGSSSIVWRDIYTASDSSFLELLDKDKNRRTASIVGAYRARRLFQPVYEIEYREPDDTEQSQRLWNDLYEKYRDPVWRKAQETLIEEVAGLKPGSVVIYCPKKGMNLKRFEMLVQSEPMREIKYLKDILDPNRRDEMTAINTRFAQLWKLRVLADPEQVGGIADGSEQACNVSALCEQLLECPNSIARLQGKGKKLVVQVADRTISEYQKRSGNRVPYDVYHELQQGQESFRGADSDLFARMRDHLEVLMRLRDSGH